MIAQRKVDMALKPRIRVCVVMPGHWSAFMGGAQYQTQRIVEALVKDGRFKVHYLARSFAPDYQPDTYDVHTIHTLFGKRKGYLFLDAPSLLRTLKAIKPDVIYQRVGSSYTGVAAWYAVHNHCRMVWHTASELDVTPYRVNGAGVFRPWQWADKKILEYGVRYSPYVVTQTQDQQARLIQHYQRQAAAVIPNFHPLPKSAPRKPERVRVVWLANLKRLKRPEIFIDLARDLCARTDAQFTMVGAFQGSTKWRERIRQRIEETPNLEYLGYMPQDEVNELLAGSHILVNTSTSEGFSNTFIQAWMREMPVISLAVNPDGVFDDERLGLHTGSYAQLVHCTQSLIENGERRRLMGSQSAEYARCKHSDSNLRELLSLFVP